MSKIITIASAKLGKQIVLVYDSEGAAAARDAGEDRAIYTAADIPAMKGIDDKALQWVQEIKEVFGDAEVVKVEIIYLNNV